MGIGKGLAKTVGRWIPVKAGGNIIRATSQSGVPERQAKKKRWWAKPTIRVTPSEPGEADTGKV
jgi:hypothetical protein